MNVLIITPTTENWPAFATWYSVRQNLPSATTVVAITHQKNETPFQMFQWAKRLNVRHFYSKIEFTDNCTNKLAISTIAKEKNLFTSGPLLILAPYTLVFNDQFSTDLSFDEFGMFIPNVNDLESLINQRQLNNLEIKNTLISEANETSNLQPVVSYFKGCGKWINTLRGCPFTNAVGLGKRTMTENEFAVIDLWKQMALLYQATA